MSEPLNISSRVFLFDLNLKTLEELFASWGEPVYRARQLWHAVYVELVPNFEAISTFPKSLRTRLNENIDFRTSRRWTGSLPVTRRRSKHSSACLTNA